MEKFNLRSLVEIVLKRKIILIGITGMLLILAVFYHFIIVEDVYQATAVVETYSLASQEEDELTVESILGIEAFSPATYENLIRSDELLTIVLEELEIDDEYSVSELLSKISVSSDDEAKTISVRVRSSDPERAAAIANSIAENFANIEKSTLTERAVEISRQIEEQLTQASASLEELEEERREFLFQPRSLEEVSREMTAKLVQITNYKTDITDARVRLNAISKSLEVLNDELTDLQPTISTSDGTIANELYVVLSSERVKLSSEYEGVNARMRSLEEQILLLEEELRDLRVEKDEKEAEEAMMEKREAGIRETYEFFFIRHEKLEEFKSNDTEAMEFIFTSRAQASSSPLGANKIQRIIVVGALGFIVSIFVVFIMEYWEISGKKRKNERNLE